ncbi:MAG: 3-deoxy-D-manno-octulosonic acid transferase [Planctomycetota bacterium]
MPSTSPTPPGPTGPPGPPVSHDLTDLPLTVPASAGASLSLSMAYLAGLSVAWPLLVHRLYIKKKPIVGGREKRGFLPDSLKRPPPPSVAVTTAGPNAPFGLGTPAGPGAGKRLWIHAVSLGEVNAAKPLIARLRAAGCEVLLSTTTATGRAAAEKTVGPEHCFFYPYDLAWMVQRAFEHLRPDLVILMELEVWPNFMREACHRDVPVVVVNGRLTERSLRRYRKVAGLFGAALRRCTAVLAQDDTFAARFAQLGVTRERLRVSGSMKYDAVDTGLASTPLDQVRRDMRQALRIDPAAPVWVAGSLHPGEEPAAAAAWRAARAAGRALVPVVVPRHPERFDAMAQAFTQEGFQVHRKTALDAGAEPNLLLRGESADLVLGDTMGELKNIYAAADLALVGGSFIPHGGQNPAEPLGLGVPCLCGPSMFNFEEIAQVLSTARALTQVADGAALGAALVEHLTTGDLPERGARGRAALIAKQGATERTATYLLRLLAR